MESSSPSDKTADSIPYMWSKLVGSVIAILTLTLPLLIIAYYSSSPKVETIPRIINYQNQEINMQN